MRRKCFTIPLLAFAMLAIAIGESQAQRSGGGPGGSRGMPSPDELWGMYGGGPDGILDLSKNPQAAAKMQQRGYTIPKDGIVRKDQFLAQAAQRMQAMQSGGMGGPPAMTAPPGAALTVILVPGEEQPPAGPPGMRGPGSGPPGMGGPPSRDRGDRGDKGEKSGGERGPGGFGGRGGEDTRKNEDPDDALPNVLRYGKTPKELPSWFIELDADKDAQIGLYEWRAAGKSVEEFLEKDLNGDGFLTADEVLKSPGAGSGSTSKTDGASKSNPFSRGGAPSASVDSKANDTKNNKSNKNDNKAMKDDKKPAPSSGGNPFIK